MCVCFSPTAVRICPLKLSAQRLIYLLYRTPVTKREDFNSPVAQQEASVESSLGNGSGNGSVEREMSSSIEPKAEEDEDGEGEGEDDESEDVCLYHFFFVSSAEIGPRMSRSSWNPPHAHLTCGAHCAFTSFHETQKLVNRPQNRPGAHRPANSTFTPTKGFP